MIINPRLALDNGWITFPNRPMESNQLQQNGIDVRIDCAYKIPIHKTFMLLVDDAHHLDRYTPKKSSCKGRQTILMERGIPYNADCFEYVSVPKDVVARVYIRSTLNMNGVWGQSTLYDSGFENFVGLMLYPWVPFEVHVGARIAQIVFMKAESNSLYRGHNQIGFEDHAD